MDDKVQVLIDRDVYDRLQMLMVPPLDDANAVIKELLFHDGRTGRAAVALEASERSYSYDEELERSRQGVYECGGGT